MKLLFLTHRLPCPPDRGCKVRSAAILNWLAEKHEVWCAGFVDNCDRPEMKAETDRSVQSVRSTCQEFMAVPFPSRLAGYRALGRLATGGTATEGYFQSRALADAVSSWSKAVGFDAVFAFSSGMAPLAMQARARRRVLCMDDLDSRKWQELAAQARWPMSWVYGAEARRLAARELEWIDQFDATLMVSQREADLVTDSELRSKVHVIPPILPEIPVYGEPISAVSEAGPVVGFVGAMDYQPNVDAACWLAKDIWPRIRRGCGDAKLTIVGRSPVQSVRDLGRDSSIEVTGTVPDVNSYLATMRVHVAPLRIARGVQIKVLQAMALGRPCVVTSCVAEGLGARAGRDLVVADSPAVFATAVIDLLEHPDKAQRIGVAGKRFVAQLDPAQTMGRVERLLWGEASTEREYIEQPTRRVVNRPEPALVCHQ